MTGSLSPDIIAILASAGADSNFPIRDGLPGIYGQPYVKARTIERSDSKTMEERVDVCMI